MRSPASCCRSGAIGYWSATRCSRLAVRNASVRRPATKGQTAAFHSWRIENGFNLPASAHTNLIAVMSALIDRGLAIDLDRDERLRLNHPSAVLKNYQGDRDQAGSGERISPTLTLPGPELIGLNEGPRQRCLGGPLQRDIGVAEKDKNISRLAVLELLQICYPCVILADFWFVPGRENST